MNDAGAIAESVTRSTSGAAFGAWLLSVIPLGAGVLLMVANLARREDMPSVESLLLLSVVGVGFLCALKR